MNPVPTVDGVADAQQWFHQFATRSTDKDELYSRMGLVFAADPELASLLLAARPTQRNPPLVYAAIHDLLLAGDPHPLGTHYATIVDNPSTEDPEPALRDFIATHRDALTHLVATRATQTNSIERSTVLLVLLARLGAELGPLAFVDVGTSGAGNLLFERYVHRFMVPHESPGGADSITVQGPAAVQPPLELTTRVSGPAPIPSTMPVVGWRRGLDQSPVDLDDPEAVRWLLACVWPSDLPRFRRLERAIEVVRAQRPTVVRGDAVDDLAAVVEQPPADLHLTLTTSWVLNYLPPARQRAFLRVLDQIGSQRDLTLITFEAPRRTSGLVAPSGWEDEDRSVLGWYRWRGGHRTVEHVADAHAHGQFIHWWDTPIP